MKNKKYKSRSRERSRQKYKVKEKFQKIKVKSRRDSREWDRGKHQEKRPRQKPKINSFFLTDMIMQQKRDNKQMDDQQIQRATNKLHNDFKEKTKPVNMSSYLSDQSLRIKKLQQAQVQGKKKYICELDNCKMSLQNVEQLQKHIQKHKSEI